MHDFFDIVGLSRSAGPLDVRRVCARVVRRAHPDFQREGPGGRVPVAMPDSLTPSARRDAAVDFVDMSAVIDSIQASFFSNDRN